MGITNDFDLDDTILPAPPSSKVRVVIVDDSDSETTCIRPSAKLSDFGFIEEPEDQDITRIYSLEESKYIMEMLDCLCR